MLASSSCKRSEGMTDRNYRLIEQQIFVDSSKIKKIDINFALPNRMKGHPYIGNKLLDRILKYRQLKGGWRSIEDLTEQHILTAEQAEGCCRISVSERNDYARYAHTYDRTNFNYQFKPKSKMIIMPIKEGENIERALKKFKRKYERTGVLKELRRRQYFTSRPSWRARTSCTRSTWNTWIATTSSLRPAPERGLRA